MWFQYSGHEWKYQSKEFVDTYSLNFMSLEDIAKIGGGVRSSPTSIRCLTASTISLDRRLRVMSGRRRRPFMHRQASSTPVEPKSCFSSRIFSMHGDSHIGKVRLLSFSRARMTAHTGSVGNRNGTRPYGAKVHQVICKVLLRASSEPISLAYGSIFPRSCQRDWTARKSGFDYQG